MASSVIGALRVTLGLDSAAFERGAKQAQGSLSKFGAQMQRIGGTMSVAVTAPLVAFGVQASRAAVEAEQALAQVNAALTSMGPVAGRTAEQLQEQAKALMGLSTFDDDEILRKVTSNLLTFGNVAGEQFDRAQRAAVDMATRLNMDLQPATVMIGKALNDPIKGITALGRAGIQFSQDQKAAITAMTQTGNIAGAQKIILGELERQFSGAGKAMQDATPGDELKDAWSSFQEVIGGFVVKILPPLTNFLTSLLNGFNQLSPGMQTFAAGALGIAAAAGPLLTVFGTLASAIGSVLPLFASGGGLAAAIGALAPVLGPVVIAVGAFVAAWLLFGDKVMPILQALYQRLVETLGPKVTALIETIKAVLTELWQGPFGEAIRIVIGILGELAASYTQVLGQNLINILSAAIELVRGAFEQIGNFIRLVIAILKGDWAGAWDAAKAIVTTWVNTVLNVFSALAPGVTESMRMLYEGVRNWLQARLGQVLDWVSQKVKAVGAAFFELYDAVVGHSYVPDMVDGIASEFARLPEIMVAPGQDAASSVGDAFQQAAGKVGNALGEMVRTGKFSFSSLKDLAGSLAQDLFVTPFLNSLGGTGGQSGGGLGSLFQGLLGSLFGGGGFGGFRAEGGSVVSGRSYVVGERGPEIFRPSSSGEIIPNGSGWGGAGTTQIFNISTPDANSFRASQRQIARQGRQQLKMA